MVGGGRGGKNFKNKEEGQKINYPTITYVEYHSGF